MKKLLLLLLCLLVPCAASAAYTLPIDLSVGMPLNDDCYTDENTYIDPTIEMHITTGFDHETVWWMADVVIGDASQLRTMPASSFTSSATIRGRNLSRRANAVLAVNGDFFSIEINKKGSYVLRQGTLYSEHLIGRTDILLIDEAGDFHVIRKANEGDVPETIDGRAIVNGLCFGPVLVENGAVCEVEEDSFIATDKERARVALCQVGPLHYAVVVSSGPAKGSKGMTLAEFADTLGTLGLQTAYNLDGGNSAMMFTGDRMINVNRSTRDISDIVYFASAWTDGEAD